MPAVPHLVLSGLGAVASARHERDQRGNSSLLASAAVNLAQAGDRSFLDVVNPSAKLCQIRDLSIALIEVLLGRIVTTAIAARFSLKDVGALAAKRFIILKHISYFGRLSPFQENCQSYAVFDRLIGSLPKGVEAWHGPRRPIVQGAH